VTFFEEIKRRNVLRVAGGYAVAGWIIAQVVVLMVDAFGLPQWLDAATLIVLFAGFPIAVGIAWFFQWTPQGLRPHAALSADGPALAKADRRVDYAILGGLALVAIMMAVGLTTNRPAAAAGLANSSIAVLPFVDMSPEKDQEYFSDGLTEELLNSLAQIDGLQVAGRTSSFAFKGDNRDLREIGQVLEVAHILEGSVRKSGDKLRITAQLIKANDGFHVWSRTFDTQLTDVFSVQDEITREIVAELSPLLPAPEQSAPKPVLRADLGAYDLFLLARDKIVKISTEEASAEAATLLDQALAKEPGYVPAMALRALVAINLAGSGITLGDQPADEALLFAKRLVDKALELDPSSPDAHYSLGVYYTLQHYLGQATSELAVASYKRALSARPSFPQAQNDLGYQLMSLGRYKEAREMFESAIEHDPLIVDANVNLIAMLRRTGQFDAAAEAVESWRGVQPDSDFPPVMIAQVNYERGRLAEARAAIGEIAKASPDAWGLDNLQVVTGYALGDPEAIEKRANQQWMARAALLRRDIPGAARAAAADTSARANPSGALNAYALYLHLAGRNQEVRDFFEPRLKSEGALAGMLSECICSPAFAISAMRDAGSSEAPRLMREWASWAALMRADMAMSPSFLRSEGDRLAMEGDASAAARSYEAAIHAGWRDPTFIDPAMRPFAPDTAPMKAPRALMKQLVNAERQKVGLPPLP